MTQAIPRRISECPVVIFIAYTVGADAEPRGYSDWLVAVDNPFFNTIPGTRCYANWRVGKVLSGGPLDWDYFDFQGLESEADLEKVWFNPDLDAFRAEWLRLWGYGRPKALDVHRHAYVMRPVTPFPTGPVTGHLRITAGTGTPPEGAMVFRVDGVLRKHFATGGGPTEGWHSPALQGNPLGVDWMALSYGETEGAVAEAPSVVQNGAVDLTACLIAEPSAEG
ncbi:MAG: hypothetical protein Q7J57_13120 [Gemmobacter sp.]|nr:hypothetical protein [Gemmobacter sp.]